MNVGIVTSFVIAALLLISVMAWNARVSQNSGVVTLSQMTKQRAEGIGETLSFDLRNLGQGIAVDPIISVDSNSIELLVFNPTTGAQNIKWEYDYDEPMSGTLNPNDHVLYRVVNGVETDIRFGVTRFKLTFYDDSGSPTLDPDDIRKIRVLLKVESPTAIDFGRYVTTYWETEISPRALR
jgi:hypothetical protein